MQIIAQRDWVDISKFIGLTSFGIKARNVQYIPLPIFEA